LLSFQTQEALFAALRITFFSYAWGTSPINDSSSLYFGIRSFQRGLRVAKDKFLKSGFLTHLAFFETGFFDFFSVGKTWLWQNIVWAAYSLQTSSDESLWLCRVQRTSQRFFCCPKNVQFSS